MTTSDSNNKSTTIVIFGASGDLTHRKLIPALYNNFKKNRLPDNLRIVGYARRPWSDDEFRGGLEDALKQFAAASFDSGSWAGFAPRLSYFQGNLDSPEDYQKLQSYLRQQEGGPANRLYYLATSPNFYGPA